MPSFSSQVVSVRKHVRYATPVSPLSISDEGGPLEKVLMGLNRWLSAVPRAESETLLDEILTARRQQRELFQDKSARPTG